MTKHKKNTTQKEGQKLGTGKEQLANKKGSKKDESRANNHAEKERTIEAKKTYYHGLEQKEVEKTAGRSVRMIKRRGVQTENRFVSFIHRGW